MPSLITPRNAALAALLVCAGRLPAASAQLSATATPTPTTALSSGSSPSRTPSMSPAGTAAPVVTAPVSLPACGNGLTALYDTASGFAGIGGYFTALGFTPGCLSAATVRRFRRRTFELCIPCCRRP